MHVDNVPRSLLVLMVPFLAFLGACDAGCRPDSNASPTGFGRFEISAVRATKREPGTMIRLDTATGRVWEMGALAEGRWNPYAEGDDGVPSPEGVTPGRYSLVAFAQPRAGVTLVRVDSVTGRVWRRPAKHDGGWVLIPQPEEAPPAAATAQ